jgi:YVTN family beta-propeller protein
MDDSGSRPTGHIGRLNPEPEDAHAAGVSRRRLLRTSAAAGIVGATAGCLGGIASDEGAPTVFVFNTGDRTVSIIDATTQQLVRTTHLGTTASFPSNQYAPRLTDTATDALWLNVTGGVTALDAKTLERVAHIETGSAANWLERSPSGDRVIVSAREPAHKQVLIEAGETSNRFGEVTETIDRANGYDGPRGGPGPCDITFAPDGTFAFIPDIYASTLTVLDAKNFNVATQIAVEPVVKGAKRANPWMGTASWDGNYLVVENDEGTHGTESIWDVSDPTAPEEVERLTKQDNLGTSPLTNEIGPNNRTSYVFTPGTKDITIIDLDARAVEKRIDLGGRAYTGTWDPSRQYLYVPVQSSNEVKVIDHTQQIVTTTISVGSKPYGATAGQIRPALDATGTMEAAVASIGGIEGGETTYCIGRCFCGPTEQRAISPSGL